MDDGDLPVLRRPRRRAHGHPKLLLLLLLHLLLHLLLLVVRGTRRRGELLTRRWRRGRGQAVAYVVIVGIVLNLEFSFDAAEISEALRLKFRTLCI